MLTKFNSSNDMNTVASDAIHSYIKDGYHIDAKESVIDREKDKDCTFKAVLKKDVDGIECKTVITLNDNGDDKNKTCTYHKVETVGDTMWSEETRSFSSSTDKTKLNSAVKDHILSNTEKIPHSWWDHDDFFSHYHNTVKNIFKNFGLGFDWFDHDDFFGNHRQLSNQDSTWKCKCPSAYERLNDYLDTDKDNDHVKVEAKDSLDDIYNKILAKNNEKSDKKKVPIESLYDKKADDKRMDDIVDKVKTSAADNKKVEDKLPKQDPDDTLEDSLIKLVRYIFGK